MRVSHPRTAQRRPQEWEGGGEDDEGDDLDGRNIDELASGAVDRNLDGNDQDNVDDADPEPATSSLRTGTITRYQGPKNGTVRRQQFDHLASWLDDLRARGLDEDVFPNTLCPPTATTRDAWRRDFLNAQVGLDIRRSIGSRAKGGDATRRATQNRAKAAKPTMVSAIAAASLSVSPRDLGLSSVVPRDKKRWQAVADASERLQQLASESSIDAKGLQIAGCIDCREVVVLELDRRTLHTDWAHFCDGKNPRRVKGVEHRARCWESRLFFACETFRFPALQEQVGRKVVYLRLTDVLDCINDPRDRLHVWSPLVPPS